MNLKNELASRLIAYCIELGQITFDAETVRRKEINANSQVIEWKIPAHQKEDATEFLKLCFPDVEDSLINETINEHLV